MRPMGAPSSPDGETAVSAICVASPLWGEGQGEGAAPTLEVLPIAPDNLGNHGQFPPSAAAGRPLTLSLSPKGRGDAHRRRCGCGSYPMGLGMDVVMPQLGETVAEGKVSAWFKAPGDRVEAGENLFEIETDKVTMEVQALSSGVLSEVRVKSGETAPVGAVVAVIGEAGGLPPTPALSDEGRGQSASPSPLWGGARGGAAPPTADLRACSVRRNEHADAKFRQGERAARLEGHAARAPAHRAERDRPFRARREGEGEGRLADRQGGCRGGAM